MNDHEAERAAEAELWAKIGALGKPRGDELGDEAMMERVLQQAAVARAAPAAPRTPRRASARRGVATAFAAIGLAATLAAFASVIGGRVLRATGAEPGAHADAGAASSGSAAAPKRLARAPEEEAAPVVAPPVTSAPAASEAPRVAPPSADVLLRRAQTLLGAGRTPEAVEAYRDLVARHPGSAEARAALVSLGRLSLAGGRAAEALGWFDRYLASPGALGEEARYGRIEALRRLGRGADEATAIGEFLRRHPESVHAERLRARAESLGGG